MLIFDTLIAKTASAPIGQQVDIAPDVVPKIGKIGLPVQNELHRPLLRMVFPVALQFRRLIRLPSKHGACGIVPNQGIHQLFDISPLPDVFSLESRYKQLIFVNLVENLRNLHGPHISSFGEAGRCA